MKSNIIDLSRSIRLWDVASVSVTSRMHEIGLLDHHQVLATRLLEIPAAYVGFVQHTTSRLSEDLAPSVLSGLRGSLNLVDFQLLEMSDAINALVAVPDDSDAPHSPQTLDAPFAQQEELLATDLAFDEHDIQSLMSASPSSQIVMRSTRIMKLVAKCNEAANTSIVESDIFTPSTRMLVAYCDLPWMTSTDQTRFGQLVDYLYFIFYEGAGADNLRFHNDQGGPLADADCTFVWHIKTLRNKWIRHDVDHGSATRIRRSWDDLAACFRWLGLEEHPTSEHHFRQMHVKLLETAEEFLQILLSKISLKAD